MEISSFYLFNLIGLVKCLPGEVVKLTGKDGKVAKPSEKNNIQITL